MTVSLERVCAYCFSDNPTRSCGSCDELYCSDSCSVKDSKHVCCSVDRGSVERTAQKTIAEYCRLVGCPPRLSDCFCMVHRKIGRLYNSKFIRRSDHMDPIKDYDLLHFRVTKTYESSFDHILVVRVRGSATLVYKAGVACQPLRPVKNVPPEKSAIAALAKLWLEMKKRDPDLVTS